MNRTADHSTGPATELVSIVCQLVYGDGTKSAEISLPPRVSLSTDIDEEDDGCKRGDVDDAKLQENMGTITLDDPAKVDANYISLYTDIDVSDEEEEETNPAADVQHKSSSSGRGRHVEKKQRCGRLKGSPTGTTIGSRMKHSISLCSGLSKTKKSSTTRSRSVTKSTMIRATTSSDNTTTTKRRGKSLTKGGGGSNYVYDNKAKRGTTKSPIRRSTGEMEEKTKHQIGSKEQGASRLCVSESAKPERRKSKSPIRRIVSAVDKVCKNEGNLRAGTSTSDDATGKPERDNIITFRRSTGNATAKPEKDRRTGTFRRSTGETEKTAKHGVGVSKIESTSESAKPERRKSKSPMRRSASELDKASKPEGSDLDKEDGGGLGSPSSHEARCRASVLRGSTGGAMEKARIQITGKSSRMERSQSMKVNPSSSTDSNGGRSRSLVREEHPISSNTSTSVKRERSCSPTSNTSTSVRRERSCSPTNYDRHKGRRSRSAVRGGGGGGPKGEERRSKSLNRRGERSRSRTTTTGRSSGKRERSCSRSRRRPSAITNGQLKAALIAAPITAQESNPWIQQLEGSSEHKKEEEEQTKPNHDDDDDDADDDEEEAMDTSRRGMMARTTGRREVKKLEANSKNTPSGIQAGTYKSMVQSH